MEQTLGQTTVATVDVEAEQQGDCEVEQEGEVGELNQRSGSHEGPRGPRQPQHAADDREKTELGDEKERESELDHRPENGVGQALEEGAVANDESEVEQQGGHRESERNGGQEDEKEHGVQNEDDDECSATGRLERNTLAKCRRMLL
ncbi:unnamed protein product [Symbiodinium natans]|uniref:Uncharacterized protein n=1 Tax=Symbiodinium natans TaxID=878477 RepID=A0A812GGF8_9DINO|nr:unnamed protein product [Symbiodinium natans]